MTQHRDFKKAVRERMAKTGESYTAARAKILPSQIVEVPAAVEWHPLIVTNQSEALILLERALEMEPRLTSAGLGVGIPGLRHYWEPSLGGANPEFNRHFFQSRGELSTRLQEIAASADWIRLQKPIKSFNKSWTSYSYKHFVERWMDRRGGPHLYVANGSFIAAALGLGFDLHQTGSGSPNCYFRFSKLTVKQG